MSSGDFISRVVGPYSQRTRQLRTRTACWRPSGPGPVYRKLFGASGLAGLLAVSIALTTGSPKAMAHGRDHPTEPRNAGNQFIYFKRPHAAPQVPMLSQDGSEVYLDQFRGKLVLLNFWATWCPPCVDELPALERLQILLADDPFELVALSIDDGSIDFPIAFVRRLGLQKLSVYHDFSGRVRDAFTIYGLPVTFLIDREGRVAGYLVGAAKWDSEESVAFLRHYMDAQARILSIGR